MIVFEFHIDHGIWTCNCRSQESVVDIVFAWSVWNTSIRIPIIWRGELVIPRIIRSSQIEWKHPTTFSGNVRPAILQMLTHVVCVNIRLQVRSTDVIHVQSSFFLITQSLHLIEEEFKVRTVFSVKFIVVFVPFHKRIIRASCCIHFSHVRENVRFQSTIPCGSVNHYRIVRNRILLTPN